MAIADDYRQFTAKHRRIILEELRHRALVDVKSSAGAADGALAAREAAPAPVQPPLYCEIDIASAEKLSSGSLIFPLWQGDEECGWCVMLKADKKDPESCDEYEIIGRINSKASGPEFMSLAYQHLLNRKLDDKTLRSDWALLESRRITRRGVLKLFLESGDAGLRNRQFLLVPDPSPWLDQLEGVLF